MIELRLNARFGAEESRPFVVKLSNQPPEQIADYANYCCTYEVRDEEIACQSAAHGDFSFENKLDQGDSVEGDVLLCVPGRDRVERLFRANSHNNTLLLTERCDQMCVMCSQPPRNSQDEWRFPLYEQAMTLVEPNSVVGISGGEPTLYLDELISLLRKVNARRPDVSFHILSNGQHIDHTHVDTLKDLHSTISVLWGIPLYSGSKANHDLIVGKEGAFDRVMESLFLMASTGASIELRTVLTQVNALDLPKLAAFVTQHLSFIERWAIMAMEPIGFAKANRKQLFFDHSVAPQVLMQALDICRIRAANVQLYNFPRCTVPPKYRQYCARSISDWKQKYLPVCEPCRERDLCCGFFEWYGRGWEWSKINPIGERHERSDREATV